MDNNTRTNEEEALKEEKKKNRMRKAGIVLAVLGIYAILAVVHFTFFDDRMVAFDDFVDDTEIAFAPPEEAFQSAKFPVEQKRFQCRLQNHRMRPFCRRKM